MVTVMLDLWLACSDDVWWNTLDPRKSRASFISIRWVALVSSLTEASAHVFDTEL